MEDEGWLGKKNKRGGLLRVSPKHAQSKVAPFHQEEGVAVNDRTCRAPHPCSPASSTQKPG